MNLQVILKLSQFGGWLKLVPKSLHEEAEWIHDQWLEVSSRMAKNRHEELRAVRKSVREWVESPEMAEFGKKARIRYLKQRLENAKIEFQTCGDEYVAETRGLERQDELVRLSKMAEGLKKKINGYKLSIDVLEGRRSSEDVITDEMIERARDYSIQDLLERGVNGRSKCCFHQGEGWNMDIRKNFAYCYVCGESGDAIKVYMALNNVTFREAIISLQ